MVIASARHSHANAATSSVTPECQLCSVGQLGSVLGWVVSLAADVAPVGWIDAGPAPAEPAVRPSNRFFTRAPPLA